ncbi:hypothetical protein LJC06_02040 [Bacteroidales bacterium OttesenSCG-928-I14]|nr:hypothetical protein [Bacteroidales bacterium OttesenSCG-928-I14]
MYYPGDKGLGVTINKTPKHIEEIKRMNIYEIKYLATKEHLLHEFMHALGLWHAKRKYDYYINIRGYGSLPYELTLEEADYWLENKFPISEQEKRVIQMLYSSDLKSGYTRDMFLYEMNIRDEWEEDIKR